MGMCIPRSLHPGGNARASPGPWPWALKASCDEITSTEVSCKHSQEPDSLPAELL